MPSQRTILKMMKKTFKKHLLKSKSKKSTKQNKISKFELFTLIYGIFMIFILPNVYELFNNKIVLMNALFFVIGLFLYVKTNGARPVQWPGLRDAAKGPRTDGGSGPAMFHINDQASHKGQRFHIAGSG